MVEGAITGLIGPNGSGKTAVLNLVTSEFRPDHGAILLGGPSGHDIAVWPPFRICRARIARTFQLVRVLPYMTVRDNVMLGRMFGSQPTGPARAVLEADALIDRVGLSGSAGLRGAQLTYIDQKRVELARALACRPEVSSTRALSTRRHVPVGSERCGLTKARLEGPFGRRRCRRR